MSKVQTDNSYLELKIEMRVKHLPPKEYISVLDIYSGDGLIWNAVKSRTNKKITVLRIDRKLDKKGVYLKGDNLKYLDSIDLDQFDVIDVDAYVIPFKQLKNILERNYKGVVFITYIQSMFGALPKEMLMQLGFSSAMIKKIPSIFNQKGLQKLFDWLSIKGIKKVKYYDLNRKNYLIINY